MSEQIDIFTLITGASSGIGKAVAAHFEKSGKNLLLTARNTPFDMEMPEEDIVKMFLAADVCKEEEFEFVISQVSDYSIEAVLFAAGQNRFLPHRSIGKADLSQIMEVNALAPLHNLSQLIRYKKLKPGASVLFMSSIAAQMASPGMVAYAAAKGAIEAAVKTLAIEHKNLGIRINALACGMIDTPMTRNLENYYPEGLDGEMAKYPIKGEMQDVVNWIAFLLSDKSGWLTGQTITLDGGMTLQ